MIAALFALAAAMLIAGVAAIVEGFPYVRLESGMAMVYGGAVVASSGVLLFGLGVVATWLRRIETAIRENPARPADEAVELGEPALMPAPEAPGASFVPTMTGHASDRQRIEPSLILPPQTLTAEPELPLPGLTPPVIAPVAEVPPPAEIKAQDAKSEPRLAEEDDLFVPGQSEPAKSVPESEPALRSSLDAAPETKVERTVVGRYSSGGNTYMMYDNGSIEADTPNGRFTFASLEELKAFVDGGGEVGARGAA
ncbi:hypothetical protein ACFQE0_03060 [Methylobacterium komagatae]|uniref:DUF308 domain-containing protein n=1 Tax=Methylobacterium komagatae TaxID=374425 RepID=A0ABW2BEI1_9HYPH